MFVLNEQKKFVVNKLITNIIHSQAASGTLLFDTALNIILALVLIVMPLYGAFSGYMSIKKKIQDLQSHLNGLYIMHNISSNNGAISQVLDEALEQEDKVGQWVS